MFQRKRRWQGDEIEQLWLRFPTEGPVSLATEFARTTGSVNAMAARLRLRSLTRRTRQGQTRKSRAWIKRPPCGL
jgi:hypothetical protein